MPPPRPALTPVPGLSTRRVAADIVDGVLRRRRPLEEQLTISSLGALPERDRALARAIVGITLRRLGTLRHLLSTLLERGVPKEAPQLEAVLLTGAAQILLLEVPDHAAVDLGVRLSREERHAARFAGLVNAVLRRLSREGAALLAGLDAIALDTPDWLMRRWIARYGSDTARAIAAAHAHEPGLDVSVKADPEGWAQRLNGRALDTGSVRFAAAGPVSQLGGFAEGEWWVQDAAAALPARLLCHALGDMRGRAVADLCAAPGGKTAQLAQAGARVVAVDRSPARLGRLRQNLARLKLEAEVVEADAAAWDGGPFDGVLLDAPCSATGTIRRHPDIPWLKSPADLGKLGALQGRLLDRAAALLKPGGVLVYCTCSLEAEECEAATDALLGRQPQLRRSPIKAAELAGHGELLTAEGDLRSLPCHWPDPDPPMAGLDGFYAARLTKLES